LLKLKAFAKKINNARGEQHKANNGVAQDQSNGLKQAPKPSAYHNLIELKTV